MKHLVYIFFIFPLVSIFFIESTWASQKHRQHGFNDFFIAKKIQTPRNTTQNNFNHETRSFISSSQAAAIAESQYGGKVLSINLEQNIYRIKLIRNGRVKTISVPATQ